MSKILLLISLAAACAMAGWGSTVYTYNVGSNVDSVSITQSQHGFSSAKLAVDIHDQNGVKLGTGDYSYSIDGGSYTVSLSFTNTLGSGSTIRLIGPFAGSDTTAVTDFRLEMGASNYLLVCGYCTSSAIAKRSYSSKVFVMETPSSFHFITNPGSVTYVRAYIQDNAIVFGVSASSANAPAAASGAHTRVDYNISSYPAGSIHLGTATWSIGFWQIGYWSSVSNDRPQEFQ